MPTPGTRNITALLLAWKSKHNIDARDRLFTLAEGELLKIAASALSRVRPLQNTVEPRELVSEFYLRIAEHPAFWENRHKFYAMVRTVMRNLLLDVVKRDRAAKRPQSALKIDNEVLGALPGEDAAAPFERLYASLETLEQLNPRHAKAFELYYLAGVPLEDVADSLGVSTGTVKRDLRMARAWITLKVSQGN